MLSDLQKRNLTRFFNIYDFDGNGHITKEDPKSIIQNLAKTRNLAPGSDEFKAFRDGFMIYWNTMIQMIDADHDGQIELDEWLQFHEMMLPNRAQFQQVIIASAKFMFDLMDADGDGKLDLEEYREWMHAFRIPGEDIVEDVFHHLDLNDNGEITMNEMEEIIVQFFYSDDPDAPGHWALGKP